MAKQMAFTDDAFLIAAATLRGPLKTDESGLELGAAKDVLDLAATLKRVHELTSQPAAKPAKKVKRQTVRYLDEK